MKRFGIVVAVILVAAIAYSYSWTFTPHGRMNYWAALSLRLLSFEHTVQPRPESDFEITLPINLIYAFSGMTPREKVGSVENIAIPSGHVDVPARIYYPRLDDDAPKPPIIVYFHGGGFTVGSVEIFDPLTRSVTNATNALVISVDYRLAPENPWPAAVDDSYAAVEWAAANAERLGADPTKLVVAGDSAGGNLAAVMSLKARDENGPAIAAQVLYYPATDLTKTSYPSRENFEDGYGLSKKSIAAFNEGYVGHIEDNSAAYISPLYAPSLEGLPPALVVTAGFDPLTDSAHAYADRLSDSGVDVTTRLYSKVFHGFMSIRFFPQRRRALVDTRDFLDGVFENSAVE